MTLNGIKNITNNRTPKKILKVFVEQSNKLNNIITEYINSRTLILTLQKTIEQVIDINENKIELIYEPDSSIFIGQQNDYTDGKTDWDALLDFYNYCEQNGANINLYYSAWGIFSEERIKKGDWKYPDRFYLNCPESGDKNRQAGM